MSQELIGRSPALKKLQDEGYGIQEKGGLVIVHQIPYVNNKKEVCSGTLVSELTLASAKVVGVPSTHVIYFIGEYPCDVNGQPLTALRHSSSKQTLGNGIVVDHSFSNKPGRNYLDYYEKITTYCNLISSPAKAIDPNVTEKNFMVFSDATSDSVFHYTDTNASRANILSITEKLEGQKIAIIGVGGTGSYIFDFVAKTPVQEIHLFDADTFYVHNAFRAPGAASDEDLNKQLKKVEYLKSRYSVLHKNIVAHPFHISDETIKELSGMSYVFIAVDKGDIKNIIIKSLLSEGITFIDVGMGINVVNNSLMGMLRVTTGSPTKNDHLSERISFADDRDDEYATNIQIAELNALNAALAVIKWKKLCGFYNDLEGEYHTTYSINVSQMVNDEVTL
ncbi:ThiF family adenylyltransferase [Lacibacter sediminis]|uniref:ThiF family adenylyltransferase n=1 Tax=Lacibacter sediminis TaxID=2760713 RepID=A0A7G5XK53_9BACT|nr:ThiF family adenylyltransferase [Lacibacter sediminis]QNA45856.1 ThiF family adenylyltransferase [Lacibacter sediminis]